jgi:hypothetical protein
VRRRQLAVPRHIYPPTASIQIRISELADMLIVIARPEKPP